MVVFHESFTIQTPAQPSFTDVTERAGQAVARSGVRHGILVVYSQHTTCSVIIQEDSIDTTLNGNRFLLQDLLDIFEGLVPTCRREGQYLHPGPRCVEHSTQVVGEEAAWTLNTDAHLRSSLIGRSETIPIVDGRPELGEFGHIYFADFDGTRARERTVRLQVLGE
jgi:thiamine phosphate synthase YjbQ (UPF0047 family)